MENVEDKAILFKCCYKWTNLEKTHKNKMKECPMNTTSSYEHNLIYFLLFPSIQHFTLRSWNWITIALTYFILKKLTLTKLNWFKKRNLILRLYFHKEIKCVFIVCFCRLYQKFLFHLWSKQWTSICESWSPSQQRNSMKRRRALLSSFRCIQARLYINICLIDERWRKIG